jgi:two-component system, OmpR family, sensor kinase
MMRKPIYARLWEWLGSLAAQTMLVVLLGIAAMHVASLWVYHRALVAEAELANEARLADRLLAIKRSVLRAEPEQREVVAHDMSGGAIEAHWSRTELAVKGGAAAERWQSLGNQLLRLAPELAADGLVIGASGGSDQDPHVAVISMRLPDQTWVNVSLLSWTPHPTGFQGTVLSTSFMAAGALLIAVLLVRTQTRPLSVFVKAAGRIAHEPRVSPVEESGPKEVRELAIAFNDMQARIGRLIDDRTHALAAVSHDLKTPITRLRFRTEELQDIALRESVTSDLDEMERMIDQTLSYLREERGDEELKPVDVVAILETVTDDVVDAGGAASLDGSASAVVLGRRLALKRAFGNLVGNAVKYGQWAKTTVTDGNDAVRITIADQGPGISVEDRERALRPFVRLEPSRNSETGGFGLGLSIADAVIRGHGGRLELRNGERSGLVVTVVLPKGEPVRT